MSKAIQSSKSLDSRSKPIALRTGGSTVKITFELGDPTPEPTAEPVSAKAAKTAAPTETTPKPKPPEPKSAEPVAEKPIPQLETQPMVSDASQPVVSNMHSFDHQGGVNVIDDPRKGQPGVYQFVQPKGEA